MASRNIFASTPPSTKRKTADYTLGEVIGKCALCPSANVTRCCATFGGCENFGTKGCKFKISILSAPSPCKTCLSDIKPVVLCLGVPNPNGVKTKSGKQPYVNKHYKWEDCFGLKIKLSRDGKQAFRFIEKVEAEDARIGQQHPARHGAAWATRHRRKRTRKWPG